MRVLLIRPPDLSLGKLKKVGGVVHPLNLVYLATYIAANHEVKILDLEVEKLGGHELSEQIRKINPDIVGITVVTAHYKNAVEISNIAKQLGKTVIWGGPHATVLPGKCLRNNVDLVVRGEGEFTFENVLEIISKNRIYDVHDLNSVKKELMSVRGISYKLNGTDEIHHNTARPLCENLDTLPIPNRRFLKLTKYKGQITPGITKPATQLLTSRGCPFQCTFCAAHIMHGKKYRVRSVENIMREIADISQLGYGHVSIDDDTFTLNSNRVSGFCDRLKEDYPDMTWNCDSRVTVTDDLLRKMKKAGCVKISFGVESGSQRILDVIKKGIKVPQIIRAFRAAKMAGIKTQAFMMIGHPSETKRDVTLSIKLINKICPDYLFLSISTPYPGTEQYDYMIRKGNLKKQDNWEGFGFFGDRINWDFDNFSGEEVVNLRNKIYRNYYLSPRYILSTLRHLNDLTELQYYLNGFLTLLNFAKR